jgi:hypothetical protein
MPQNKQKVICRTLTMAVATVAIVLLGFSSSYSSVAALSSQPVTHHNSKVFDKKQQDSTSSGEDGSSSSNTKSSDDSNNEGSSNTAKMSHRRLEPLRLPLNHRHHANKDLTAPISKA